MLNMSLKQQIYQEMNQRKKAIREHSQNKLVNNMTQVKGSN